MSVTMTSGCSFHLHFIPFQLLAEHGGALVPRDYRQAHPSRLLPERPGFDRRYQPLHPNPQSESQGFRLEHICRTNYGQNRQMLRSLGDTTLGVITEQWREGGYVIDFKVGQSFGEPQGSRGLIARKPENRSAATLKVLPTKSGSRVSCFQCWL